jgi:hypothetical protein
VTDPHHPLYGKCFPVSDRRAGRGPRVIVIRLPDGRERGISRSATALISASDDLAAAAPSRQAHISVRTLLPLANHVSAVLAHARRLDCEVDVWMIMRRQHADTVEFVDADANLGRRKFVVKFEHH